MQNFRSFNYAMRQMRRFFQDHKGYLEVPTQSRLSILAACEDPKTITQFNFDGVQYPLPQTGQMWLEYELLNNPDVPGFFCQTTSYRNEPFPIPGRHVKIFPMFEFESKGTIEDLKKLEFELLEFLGFGKPVVCNYDEMCQRYGVQKLEAEQETLMQKEFGNVICLEQFPRRTDPFWNMKQKTENLYNKIDILLYGMETLGSAERSTNVQQMRLNFMTISGGLYAELLFKAFGKERVLKELYEFLALPMIPRFGCGIGLTRLTRAMELAGLIKEEECRETESAREPVLQMAWAGV